MKRLKFVSLFAIISCFVPRPEVLAASGLCQSVFAVGESSVVLRLPELALKLKEIPDASATRTSRGMSKSTRQRFRRFLEDQEFFGWPFLNVRSPRFVTVYRAIRNVELEQLDLNANFRKNPTKAGHITRLFYGGGRDFVASAAPYTKSYAGSGKALLIRYEIPALMLKYDDNIRDEPSYFIARENLERFGLTSVAPFVTGIAKIEPAQTFLNRIYNSKIANRNLSEAEKTRAWDEALREENEMWSSDSSSRFNWIDSAQLESVVSRSQ